VTAGGIHYRIRAKRKRRTEAENDSDAEDGDEDIKMGQTVTAGAYQWKRIAGITEDKRLEPHFDTTFKTNLFNEDALELEIDIFREFMPLDRDQLLHIVRENADEDGDKRVWLG
jgi:hypothetical protein